jgi:hypothetical protein
VTDRREFLSAVTAMFAAPRVLVGEYELKTPEPGMKLYGNVSYALKDEKTFVTFPTYRSFSPSGEPVLVADPNAGSIDKVYFIDKETGERRQ